MPIRRWAAGALLPLSDPDPEAGIGTAFLHGGRKRRSRKYLTDGDEVVSGGEVSFNKHPKDANYPKPSDSTPYRIQLGIRVGEAAVGGSYELTPRVGRVFRALLICVTALGLVGASIAPVSAAEDRDRAVIVHAYREFQGGSQYDALYMTNMNTGESQRLTPPHLANTADYIDAFSASPNGRYLYLGTASGLIRQEVSTGRREVILPSRDDRRIRSIAVSPDGHLLAFSAATTAGGERDLWQVGSDGSNLKRLTNTPANASVYSTSEYDPEFTPDGTRIAFVVSTSNCRADIRLLNPQSGAIETIATRNRGAGGPPGGIAFVKSNQLATGFYWSFCSWTDNELAVVRWPTTREIGGYYLYDKFPGSNADRDTSIGAGATFAVDPGTPQEREGIVMGYWTGNTDGLVRAFVPPVDKTLADCSGTYIPCPKTNLRFADDDGTQLIRAITGHPPVATLWRDAPAPSVTPPTLGLPDAELAKRYRPLLRFDQKSEGGRWRPLDVERFFSAPGAEHRICGRAGTASVWSDGEGAPAEWLYPPPLGFGPTVGEAPLAAYWVRRFTDPPESPPPGASCESLQAASQLRSPRFNHSGAVLDTDGPGRRIDSDAHTSDRLPSRQAIYWDLIDRPPNYPNTTFLNYWLYYRYNDSFGGRSADRLSIIAWQPPLLHEGDWEGMSVALDRETQRMEWAGFDAHGARWRYLPGVLDCGAGDAPLGCDTTQLGLRLRTFVAYGSHASYPRSCTDGGFFDITPCHQSGTDGEAGNLTDPAGFIKLENNFGGEIPWPQNRNAAALKPLPGSDSWANWPGNWNSTAEPSVKSPLRQPQSDNPASYSCTPRWSEPTCADLLSASSTTSRSSSPSRTTSLRTVSPLSRSQLESCLPWFGLLVNTLACRPETARVALRSGTIPRAGTLAVSGSAFLDSDSGRGLAQATGDPLQPGDTLKVKGLGSGGTILLVRARDAGGPSGVWVVTPVSVRRALRGSKTPDETVTLRFSSAGRGRLVAQGTGAVVAQGPADSY